MPFDTSTGHGKGVIDAMSSFGVKNVLRRDIVTQDVFFDTSEVMVDHLLIKNVLRRDIVTQDVFFDTSEVMVGHLLIKNVLRRDIVTQDVFFDTSEVMVGHLHIKNVLRRDIVTQDVFFDTSEVMVDHLHMKTPQFYYATIDPQLLAQKRHALNETIDPIEIPGCMKKHLMVFTPNTKEVGLR